MDQATNNHVFFRTEDDGVRSEVVAPEELVKIREEGRKLLGSQMIRSCWQCNPCHAHFLEYQRDQLLWCYDCGRFYYQGVDITEYEGE
jgi:tRNA(Ile2) C34 agmatinyltransferase TiaS